MMAPTASLAYRKAALQQASTVGLVIALYDTLVGNLSRAADALDTHDIEARCAELIHGFKVLHQLDAMLDMQQGGQVAINLRRFYTHLRGQMLAAQFSLSPAILREQARLVLDVRGAWQQIDSRSLTSVRSSETAGTLKVEPVDSRIRLQEAAPLAGMSSFSCSG